MANKKCNKYGAFHGLKEILFQECVRTRGHEFGMQFHEPATSKFPHYITIRNKGLVMEAIIIPIVYDCPGQSEPTFIFFFS